MDFKLFFKGRQTKQKNHKSLKIGLLANFKLTSLLICISIEPQLLCGPFDTENL